MQNNPKVSVCVVTYNHEKYIKECLESIVTQKCDFDFEVIVGEDCSTDSTRAIVQEYVDKYPNIVKPLFHEKNVGPTQNFIQVNKKAIGTYIAHMDGDDFWYEGKLSYQVEIMENNPDIVQCWHCTNIVDKNSKNTGIFPSKLARKFYPTIIKSKDIALSYALVGHHSTQMFKRTAYDFDKLSEEALDYMGAFLISLNGKTYYSKEILSAYRYVPNNSVTSNSSSKRVTVDLLSEHLVEISEKFPEYQSEVKANMITRKIMSKFRNHDLNVLNYNLNKLKDVKMNPYLVVKSLYYFILQKL